MILFLLWSWRSPEAVTSPHGSPTQCAACHEMPHEGDAPEAIRFATGSADGACRSCHADDPHAVGLVPKEGQVKPPMLLVDGKLACVSCHDEPACDGNLLTAADFFRGGPYARVGDLCARCHEETAIERYDPHAAMAAHPADRTICEHCHQDAPDPSASVADLKVSGPDTCVGCHTDTRHAGLDGHLAAVPADMVADVRASRLPLAEGDRIVCLTCHDPHPPSSTARSAERAAIVGRTVVPPAWEKEVLGPTMHERAETIHAALDPVTMEPALLRRPLAGGELCASCHTPSAIDSRREGK
jgi:hypothetical protein